MRRILAIGHEKDLRCIFVRSVLFCTFFVALLMPGSRAMARDVLRVGLEYVSNKYVEHDDTGYYRGMDTDYMQALAGYADMDIEYVGGNREDMLRWILDGTIDVIPGFIWTEKRAEIYGYSVLPMGRSHRLLYLHDGVEESGKVIRLGFLQDFYLNDDFNSYMENENLKYEPLFYASTTEMSAAYERNEIDGFVITNRLSTKFMPVRRFGPRSLYFVVRKDRTELLKRLNAAQEQLVMNQPHFAITLYDRYQGQHIHKGLLLNKSEQDYLKGKGRLRAAVTLTGAPFAYEENGTVQGVVTRIVKNIEESIGIPIDMIPVASNPEGWAAMKNGEADFLFNQYLDYGIAREEGLMLTAPYRKPGYVAVTRVGASVKSNPVVACQRGSLRLEDFEEKVFPKEQLRYYDSNDECMKAVARGKADVTFQQDIMAHYAIWRGDFPDLMTVGSPAFVHGTSMAVLQGNAVLLSILDKEIGQMTPETIEKYMREELSEIEDSRSIRSLIYMYPIRFLVGAALVALVIIFLFWRMLAIRREHMSRMKKVLYMDRYTGFHNRLWLENEGQRLVDALPEEERGKVSALAFIMRDRMNFVSTYGRSRLDGIIREFATMLEKMPWIMAIATDSRDGHAFALTRPTTREEIEKEIEDFFKREEYFKVGEMKGRIFFSAGVSSLDFNSGAITIALNHADSASHVRSGTRDVIFYDEKMHEQVIFEQLVTELMDAALLNGEFELWLQPKYDLATHICVGAEALVRWNSPDLGFLMPGKFIRIFEKNGFVTQLDFDMLDKTYRYQQERFDKGLPIVPISVNQSRLHMQEKDYIEKMKSVHSHYTVTGGIELEITETAFDFTSGSKRDASVKIVRMLKDMGYIISMDDFGTGYSDTALLNILPMDVMKIDRSLLVMPGDPERRKNLLRQIVQMGHGFGMKVICEGIETPEQEELLIECGCEYGQGYLFGRPMRADDFTKFLETHLG